MAIAAVGQLCSTKSLNHNLAQAQVLVKKAAAASAQILFLPEASDYISSSTAEGLSLVKPVQESPFVLGLQTEARRERLAVVVGIHEPGNVGKVKNTCVYIGADGELRERYQKIHLFDVDILGGPVLKESDSVEKGVEIHPPFQTPIGKLGMTICFDLRFPEISLALKRQKADIISYPSAFTVPTGLAHWKPLLMARAIETQAYVIAAAQVGKHNETRVSYGHSMIVDPWGKVLVELGGESTEPEIGVADIDLGVREKIVRSMPLLRRTDVYPEV